MRTLTYMKRIVALFTTLLIVSAVYGQERPMNEISVAYSEFSAPQFMYVLGGFFGTVLTKGSFTFDNVSIPGAFSLEYTRYFNSHIGVGGTFTGDFMSADKFVDKTPAGKYKMTSLSLMPHVKAYWFDNLHFGMYSKCCIGAAYATSSSEHEGNFIFAAQISPVCMDFGGRTFRGFLELGAGSQGFFALGVRQRF